MKQLAENVYSITGKGFFSVPVFVLEKQNGMLTLIDTGLEKDSNIIIKKIRKKWGDLEKIERIVFTHRHYDHTAGLAHLMREMTTISAPESPQERVEIVCHEDEAPHFANTLRGQIINPNRTVKHEEIIDAELKLKAIHVPGHSWGHICLLLEKEKLLFVGDLFMWMPFGIRPVFQKYCDDYDQYLETIGTILDYKWDYAIPSHMTAKKIPRKKVEQFIKKISKKK
ncbi:MAG: MBL fold metallo-hydrolase [Candidatus Heimdallarchaeota archaeon]|nr:MBL fold metallo-hydrolase [Candidatus Heimdallarchaeota archaeon]MCK5159017.1 MBL fold metallo-hydrolase [Candidatus Heimdallarchaeota archaeon]MCK5298523.1 MBL fold metallo-hydrolase [Candidatus Heimdallarchaeota archaeon]